jgi:Protein of unknown function (DUF2924)
MNVTVRQEIAALLGLTVPQLRQRYAAVFGEPTRAGNKTWLQRRIAWRLQALAEGDLSERARQRALELANDADLRLSPPKPSRQPRANPTELCAPPPADRLPIPGTLLTRLYKGKLLQVTVRAEGFDFDGRLYRSLSAVAKAVTVSHCNGYLFFGLAKRGAR